MESRLVEEKRNRELVLACLKILSFFFLLPFLYEFPPFQAMLHYLRQLILLLALLHLGKSQKMGISS